jgi:hypothetical protein
MQLKVMRDTFCEVAQMSDTLSNSRNVHVHLSSLLSVYWTHLALPYIILEISSKNDELSNQVNLLGFELIGRLLAPDCN